jgi:hypothetical protein
MSSGGTPSDEASDWAAAAAAAVAGDGAAREAAGDAEREAATDAGTEASGREAPEARAPSKELTVIESLPGLARLAAEAWVRTAAWGVGRSVRFSARIARAAIDPESASGLMREFGAGIRAYARELLGVTDLDDRVRELMPAMPNARPRNGSRPDRGGAGTGTGNGSLRDQGAELLRQSAEVGADDGAHPAYERIIAELAPDEARLLRLLAAGGPQPSVDVRSANLIGGDSQLVAQNLNMMGTAAGCRYLDRVPAYMNNLFRLSLIWFSEEPIDDVMAYQVIEAQPEAHAAMKRAGRAKTVHRSVRLTPFGSDFCEVVLPEATGEFEATLTQLRPDR